MSVKLEQMNIRLSETLKNKITDLAKEKDLKTSDFVRQTLEDAIEGRSRQGDNEFSLSNLHSRERYILQAIAFIAHTDTGKPLVDCLKVALEVAEKQKIKDFVDPTKFSREIREKQILKINEIVSEKLQISSLALTFIRLMITTYLGIIYNQEIFQATPLSVRTMEEIKQSLDQGKAN